MAALEFLDTLPRKRVRHFNLPGDAHFLTFSCFHRLPLLSKDRTRKWFVEALADARVKHGFDLWSWVIMPEHVHLLVYPHDRDTKVSAVLADIKRPVAQKAIAYLVTRKSPFLRRLTVHCKNRTYRRFWQAGPGQDRNIYDPITAHHVVEYIHNNPQHRGLVTYSEEWYWSSARDWNGRSDVPIRVNRTLPVLIEVPSD